jgi:hypothetical protein
MGCPGGRRQSPNRCLHADGIDLDRSTLVHWIGRIRVVAAALHALVPNRNSAPKVFGGDTPLPVLDGPIMALLQHTR